MSIHFCHFPRPLPAIASHPCEKLPAS
jgi:hypothetical protein